jgi:hypothetical protein
MHSCSACVLNKQKMHPRWAAFFNPIQLMNRQVLASACLERQHLATWRGKSPQKSKGTDQIVHDPVDDLI